MIRRAGSPLCLSTVVLALTLLAIVACGENPILADPCYAATIHVDTLTMDVDSITYEWTPGECNHA